MADKTLSEFHPHPHYELKFFVCVWLEGWQRLESASYITGADSASVVCLPP